MTTSTPQPKAGLKQARRSLADLAAGTSSAGFAEAMTDARPGASPVAPSPSNRPALATPASRMAKYPSATVYLPLRALRLLKEIALEEDRRLTDLLAEALNAWFIKNGHPSLEQLGK